MPIYNITLQDFSPLIVYNGEWQVFGIEVEEEVLILANCSGSSFATTNSSGASFSLSFWGTGIYLEGAKRPSYTSIVDASRSRAIFQTALYAVSGLTSVQHVVTVNCTGEAFDIDFIKFTTGDGDESTTNEEITLDDGDPSITYLPSASDWQTTIVNQSDYFNQSAHQTASPDASVRILFSGNAIEVYGSVGRDHGVYSTRLDSNEPLTLKGTSTQYHQPSVPIFIAGGLSSGSHTLLINNTGGGTLDLDKIVTSTWPSFSGSSGIPTSPETGDASSSSSSRVGAIAGPVIGVLSFLALIVFGFVYARRRRRRVATGARTNSFEIMPRFTEEVHRSVSPILTPYTLSGVKETPGLFEAGSSDDLAPEQQLSTGKTTTEQIEPVSSGVPPSSAEATDGSVPERRISRAQTVVRETDAGPVLDPEYNGAEHLPPAYDQIARRP
ncbi:hypothetical protein ACEPAI_2359 [Sanghuangporus weigelae]